MAPLSDSQKHMIRFLTIQTNDFNSKSYSCSIRHQRDSNVNLPPIFTYITMRIFFMKCLVPSHHVRQHEKHQEIVLVFCYVLWFPVLFCIPLCLCSLHFLLLCSASVNVCSSPIGFRLVSLSTSLLCIKDYLYIVFIYCQVWLSVSCVS